MKKLLQKAEKLTFFEIKKYGAPSRFNLETANKAGQRLAKIYKANKNIVLLGTMFMDLKIGQAIKEKRINGHVKMSANAAKKFLEQQKLDKNFIKSVVHCIEAHHGAIPHKSKEARIVANADCYRFLSPLGFLRMIMDLTEMLSKEKILEYANSKIDEKWKIISLPEVKKELGPSYRMIKKLLNKAKRQ